MKFLAKYWQVLLGAVLVALLALVPTLQSGSSYTQTLLFFTMLNVAMSSSWNIIGGFAGQISFGSSAFFGIGAYTTAVLWLAGLNPLITIPLAGVLAMGYSAIVGIPTLRLRGPYFSIATIGIGEATRLLALNLDDVIKGTPLDPLLGTDGVLMGGASGLPLPTPDNIIRFAQQWYYAIIFFAAAVVLLCVWIRRSKFGLGLFSINMDTDAAETLGVNTSRYKVLAFMLSAFLIGICGSIYSQYTFYIDPQTVFGFQLSISLILMPTIGGIGTIWGPVIGAVVYTIIQNRLSTAQIAIAGQTIDLVRFNLLLYGGLLVLIILFEPKGIVGLTQRIARAIGNLRNRTPASSQPAQGTSL